MIMMNVNLTILLLVLVSIIVLIILLVPTPQLIHSLRSSDWSSALVRLISHPHEARWRNQYTNETPLHSAFLNYYYNNDDNDTNNNDNDDDDDNANMNNMKMNFLNKHVPITILQHIISNNDANANLLSIKMDNKTTILHLIILSWCDIIKISTNNDTITHTSSSSSNSSSSSSKHNLKVQDFSNTNTHHKNNNHHQYIRKRKNESIKKSIILLQSMEKQVHSLVQSYEEQLGISTTDSVLHQNQNHYSYFSPPSSTSNVNVNVNVNENENENENTTNTLYYETIQKKKHHEWMKQFTITTTTGFNDNDITMKILQTEEEYIQICIKIRQLIVRWATFQQENQHYTNHSSFAVLSEAGKSNNSTASSSNEFIPNSKKHMIPVMNAHKYLIILETLRKQRSDMIEFLKQQQQHQQDEQQHQSKNNGLFNWIQREVVNNIFNRNAAATNATGTAATHANGSSSPSPEPLSLDTLNAHLSPKYTTNVALYTELMRSYIHGQSKFNSNSQSHTSSHPNDSHNSSGTPTTTTTANNSPSSTDTTTTLESLLSFMEKSYKEGNPNNKPNRSIYHIIMNYYQKESISSSNYDNAIKSLHVLYQMRQTQHHHQKIKEEIKNEDRDLVDDDHHGLKKDTNIKNENDVYKDEIPSYPNRHSYNLVLAAFRDTVQHSKNIEEKLQVLEEAEKLLLEMEKEGILSSGTLTNDNDDDDSISTSISRDDDNNVDDDSVVVKEIDVDESISSSDVNNIYSSPSVLSYRFVLQTIMHIGERNLPDCYEKVDDLMTRLMGKEGYNRLIEDNELLPTYLLNGNFTGTTGSTNQSTVDYKLLNDLVNYFSWSNDRLYLERAKTILHKMEKIREHCLAQGNDNMIWNLSYPDHRPYNSLIVGLINNALKLQRLNTKKKTENRGIYTVDGVNSQKDQIEEDAIYSMGLLDSMMNRDSSMASAVTYRRLLRLFSLSKSKDAGEKGEEILSRMNTHMAFSSIKEPFEEFYLRSCQGAVDCWTVSAMAKRQGAAKRATQLLDRVVCHHGIKQIHVDDDVETIENSEVDDYLYLHNAVLRCCAVTALETDKADALRLAFDTYNKMQDNGILPTSYTFSQLLNCCSFASTQDQQLHLSNLVFEAACEAGCVNKHVLFRLKQVNYHLFQTYEQLPGHSIALKIPIK